jgi:hypothetical protein
MNKDLEDMLNIQESDIEVLSKPGIPSKVNGPIDLDRDILIARENIEALMTAGQGALDELMSIAQQSQHPRAYEVISTLIKTMLEGNRDIIDLYDKKKKIKEESATPENNTTNNNLFVGSTKDLKEMLNKLEDE